MTHRPILIKNVSLSFPHKTCFEGFTNQINYGDRIGIIGRNGSGKTTLLNILRGSIEPTSGELIVPPEVLYGYVPQIVEDFDSLSGGQRFNQALTNALNSNPTVLLLDEPTNHLDTNNRKSLMRMLRSYQGTLLVVTHDPKLLRTCVNTIWNIDNGAIHVFSGDYDNYMQELKTKRTSIEQELSRISRKKKDTHDKLMQEEQRTAKSKSKGEKNVANRKWMKAVGDLKGMKAEKSQGKKLQDLERTKQNLQEQLSQLRLPEVIVPTFFLSSTQRANRILISIMHGSVGYQGRHPIIQDINILIGSSDRIAVSGKNASGKSTLIRAILDDPIIVRGGEWKMPKSDDIGYLDQHYNTLQVNKTVFETIQDLMPASSHMQIRQLLNTFLFRKNEEINALVSSLSGGEKVRLVLAQIGARTPALLILDEITNNIDMYTREHVIQVLKKYPGALIIISHDEEFLKEIEITDEYVIENGKIERAN